MIKRSVHNILSHWEEVDSRELMRRARSETRNGQDHWKLSAWTRYDGCRSFILSSTGGDLYAIYLAALG